MRRQHTCTLGFRTGVPSVRLARWLVVVVVGSGGGWWWFVEVLCWCAELLPI